VETFLYIMHVPGGEAPLDVDSIFGEILSLCGEYTNGYLPLHHVCDCGATGVVQYLVEEY
jgi:hypothetical protein